MCRWMDGWMDGRKDGWIDGWMDGWMGGWMDREMKQDTPNKHIKFGICFKNLLSPDTALSLEIGPKPGPRQPGKCLKPGQKTTSSSKN